MLHSRQAIRLKQQLVSDRVNYLEDAHHLKGAGHAHLRLVLNGCINIHYDTHDSAEVALGELQACDFYFKRSFSSAVIDKLPSPQKERVFPLGLNYRVLPNNADRFAVQRGLFLKSRMSDRLSAVVRALDARNRLGFQPRVREMESLPDFEAEPKVLFLVTAYDPFDDSSRSSEKSLERQEINDTRAACIRLLKNELGSRFLGGFIRNTYTQAQYPDLIVADDVTAQKNYLNTVRSYPICVATMGLHGSTGWKLAEYVAFAKAVLSEKLQYSVPGHFDRNSNYMEFTSPEECAANAIELVENKELRSGLMANNARYYQTHLRPDALVLNSLLTALVEYYGKHPRSS